MSRIAFFQELYQYSEGKVELRALPSRKRIFLPLEDLDKGGLTQWVQTNRAENLFFGVATRDGEGGGKENIVHIPALWTDIDFKETPKEIAADRVKQFPFKPSFSVLSGGGVHLYWLLKEPADREDIERVEDANRRIAAYLGGDPNAVDAARILRIPDTVNHKYDPPRPVSVSAVRQAFYEIQDFIESLPEMPETRRHTSSHQPEGEGQKEDNWLHEAMRGVSEGGRNATATRLAGYWINKVSPKETLEILTAWNHQNNPPMKEDELRRTVDSVSRYEPEKQQGRVNAQNVYTADRMLREYREYIKALKQNRFITGIHEIDKRIRGISGGEVLTILARAGAFKTAMLQNMLANYVKNSTWGAAFFSLEMPVASLTERYHEILGGMTGKEVEELYSTSLQGVDTILEDIEARFRNHLKNLYIVPVKVTLGEIASYVGLIQREFGVKIGVVGIDYLGLIQGSGVSRYDVISALSTGAKDLAKLLNLPVILLSQVSRKGGAGETEVTLDMGRDSGAIEEGADTILGLWKEPQKRMAIESRAEPEYDLICRILKNRKGPPGSYWKLQMDPSNLRVGADAEKYEPPKTKKFGVEVG